MRINITELKERLIPHLGTLIDHHLPNAKKVSGGWRVGDLEGTKGESLHIADDGVFTDFADTDTKGNIFQLCQYFSGIQEWRALYEWAADQCGYKIPKPTDRRKASPRTEVLDIITPKALEYLTTGRRSFDEDFVRTLPIKSLSDDKGLAILSFEEDGEKCVGLKYFDFITKRWSSSQNPANILWPLNYITERFPNHTDFIVVTEGHWDAIAYLQHNIPAVSIPSGATNDKWIEECFNFLGSFDKIVLSYDNDDPGQEGIARVAARLSAILTPPRVVNHPEGCKDANDVLCDLGGDPLLKGIETSEPYSPPEILSGSSLIGAAIAAANDNPFQLSTPFDNFPFHFRSHETTLYTGYTGHGKSNLVEQFMCWLRSQYNEGIAIASFEDQPERVAGKLLYHQFGRSGLEDNPTTRDFLSQVHIYNTKLSTKELNDPRKLIDLFRHLHNRWGTTHFVIDNLMTLSISRDDTDAIVEICELFRQFVNQLPVHLHIVAHPRKPPSNIRNPGAPDPYDIRGPSEIADLSFNILSLLRCIDKERQIDLMRQNGAPPQRVAAYDKDTYDAMLICHKQRFSGVLPTLPLWYNQEYRIFKTRRQRI